jgi:hypothetical protein
MAVSSSRVKPRHLDLACPPQAPGQKNEYNFSRIARAAGASVRAPRSRMIPLNSEYTTWRTNNTTLTMKFFDVSIENSEDDPPTHTTVDTAHRTVCETPGAPQRSAGSRARTRAARGAAREKSMTRPVRIRVLRRKWGVVKVG